MQRLATANECEELGFAPGDAVRLKKIGGATMLVTSVFQEERHWRVVVLWWSHSGELRHEVFSPEVLEKVEEKE